MSPAPSPLPPPLPPIYLPTKHKQKPAVGIAAGAEDAKYQAKYKELKRKVKDIETDNDKLHFKVLQAKLSIRRMKMERAVLYERLSVAPPSPTMQDRHPHPPMHPLSGGPGHQPPSRPAPGSHQHLHPSSMDSDQAHVSPEHIRPQGNSRLAPASDGRSAPMDNPAVALSPHMPVHSPRRISGSHESSRHPFPPMQPQISASHTHPYDSSRAHSLANSHTSPPLHHTHPSSSHSRTRSHSSPHSRSQHLPSQSYRGGPGQHQHYSESLPPVHQTMHSPPPERERSRRGDPQDYAGSHADPHPYDRHQTHLPLSPRIQHSDARSTGRIHSHQRLGPGTYITREEFQDKSRDLEREREWEREHDRERSRDYNNNSSSRNREINSYHLHSPPPPPPPHSVHRSRSQIDRGDYDSHVPPPSSRSREEPAYYHDSHPPPSYPRLTRSDTPGSGSASGSGAGVADVPSRPDSRSQYYERDRGDSRFRLRPVSQPNEDIEFGHEDGSRSQARADRGSGGGGGGPGGPVGVGGSSSGAAGGGGGGGGSFSMSEPNRPPLDSRKRSRNDMDVDSDNDVGDGPSGGSSLYSSGRLHEDRGPKRYHREHTRRSVDAHEDTRMGPS